MKGAYSKSAPLLSTNVITGQFTYVPGYSRCDHGVVQASLAGHVLMWNLLVLLLKDTSSQTPFYSSQYAPSTHPRKCTSNRTIDINNPI